MRKQERTYTFVQVILHRSRPWEPRQFPDRPHTRLENHPRRTVPHHTTVASAEISYAKMELALRCLQLLLLLA
jgi:hypothetical protein